MLRSVWRWFGWDPPQGETLQERYPAAPGVPTFSYSSVDLPEEAFAQVCPWCGARTRVLSEVERIPVKVIQCRECRRITKIEDLTDVWGPDTRLVDTTRWP